MQLLLPTTMVDCSWKVKGILPMDRIPELNYAVVGEEAAIVTCQKSLAARFGNPQGNKKPLTSIILMCFILWSRLAIALPIVATMNMNVIKTLIYFTLLNESSGFLWGGTKLNVPLPDLAKQAKDREETVLDVSFVFGRKN